ncbi:MAG TPA: hypothetical protein VIB39_23330 [Candidatus Angelobacter sp.]|jgi:plastocyanin
MPSWSIDINVNEKQPPRASFSPTKQQALVGDLISWANNDKADSHWPAPIEGGKINKTGWFDQAIPPNASSKGTVSPSAPGTLSYGCALHPDELGSIEVLSSPPTTT